MRKIKIGKVVGLDGIPIEIWQCLGDRVVTWLTNLYNKILKTKNMSND